MMSPECVPAPFSSLDATRPLRQSMRLQDQVWSILRAPYPQPEAETGPRKRVVAGRVFRSGPVLCLLSHQTCAILLLGIASRRQLPTSNRTALPRRSSRKGIGKLIANGSPPKSSGSASTHTVEQQAVTRKGEWKVCVDHLALSAPRH